MTEQKIRHCTEREFWSALRADLRKCEWSVLILSPFLARARALECVREFRRLVKRGVRVCVFTRPGDEQPGGLSAGFQVLDRALKNAGVEVLYRERMHEKVVVVDRRVLWHGSLNVLSHSTTAESMLRLEGVGLVNEVLEDLRIVNLADRPGEGLAAPLGVSAGATRWGMFRVRR